jgi:hypothetical protein
MSLSAMKQAVKALEFAAGLISPITKGCQCQICLAHTTLRQAIAEAEKQEPVAWREVAGKTTKYYEYNEQGRGEPLYAAPVHAVDMSQERVDETAKREHEWVGLDDDIPGLGLVTEEFYNGMLCAEDILRKRNT